MFIYTVFSDIETLTCECKFSNCTHTKEPSCAVQKAISEGTLDISRWQSYLKLRNENEYAANGSQYLAAKRAKFKATPHKDRLMALRTPCLHLFRHLAQISLDWQPSNFTQFAQSEGRLPPDEKSDGAIRTQSLCGIALIIY